MSDWIVRIYPSRDTEDDMESFIIENRTENEAVKEAESDPAVLTAHDWTITEV